MRTWIAALVAVLVLSLGIAGCGKKEEEAPDMPQEVEELMPTEEEQEEAEGELEENKEEAEEHLHEGSGTK